MYSICIYVQHNILYTDIYIVHRRILYVYVKTTLRLCRTYPSIYNIYVYAQHRHRCTTYTCINNIYMSMQTLQTTTNLPKDIRSPGNKSTVDTANHFLFLYTCYKIIKIYQSVTHCLHQSPATQCHQTLATLYNSLY